VCTSVNRFNAKQANPLPARVLASGQGLIFPDYRINCQKLYLKWVLNMTQGTFSPVEPIKKDRCR